MHFGSNNVELDSILPMVKRYQEDIEGRAYHVAVGCYSTSLSTDEENSEFSVTSDANEVKKSYCLAWRLTDHCFVVSYTPHVIGKYT